MEKIIQASNVSKSKQQTRQSQSCRKTLIRSNTFAIFLTPSCDILSSKNDVLCGNPGNFSGNNYPHDLFNLLKEANKFMAKGAKLYESLLELRLCGWISPYTLLLTGPSEDIKVLKHAWVKRHLKTPPGFNIKECGIVQDIIVELLPQSPFLSLKTALFDAVVDLNSQDVYPTKGDLHLYLQKHYPNVKLPDSRHIYECLGCLVQDRLLYHNGCGYFVLCHVNVLNGLKKAKDDIHDIQYQSSKDSALIKGFSLNRSKNPVSGKIDQNLIPNLVSETSTSSLSGFPSSLENSCKDNPVKHFFKQHVKLKKRKCDGLVDKDQSSDRVIALSENVNTLCLINNKDNIVFPDTTNYDSRTIEANGSIDNDSRNDYNNNDNNDNDRSSSDNSLVNVEDIKNSTHCNKESSESDLDSSSGKNNKNYKKNTKKPVSLASNVNTLNRSHSFGAGSSKKYTKNMYLI